MMTWERLAANRRRMDTEISPSERQDLSPVFYAQHAAVVPLLQRHMRGEAIDIGCGHMPFRHIVAPLVSRYDTLDREPRMEGVTYLSDTEDMAAVANASYDSAMCLEVLEHVPHPARAIAEIARILRPAGVLVLSVPHLSRLHEEPHDYYRFTYHGLATLLREGGLEVIEISPKGGLLSFVGHQVSTLLLASVWHLPVLRRFVWCANTWLITRPCFRLDGMIDGGGLLALGYVAVARKPPAPGSAGAPA